MNALSLSTVVGWTQVQQYSVDTIYLCLYDLPVPTLDSTSRYCNFEKDGEEVQACRDAGFQQVTYVPEE